MGVETLTMMVNAFSMATMHLRIYGRPEDRENAPQMPVRLSAKLVGGYGPRLYRNAAKVNRSSNMRVVYTHAWLARNE